MLDFTDIPDAVHCTLYRDYFAISSWAIRRIAALEENFQRPMTRELGNKLFRLRYTSIVFSALCLEAFINHYGRKHTPSVEVYDATLQKMDVRAKWRLFPKLFANDFFPTDHGKGWKLLLKLISLRNDLVHNNPIVLNMPDGITYEEHSSRHETFEGHVKKLMQNVLSTDPIEVVVEVLSDLKTVDPSVDIGWADEVFEDDL